MIPVRDSSRHDMKLLYRVYIHRFCGGVSFIFRRDAKRTVIPCFPWYQWEFSYRNKNLDQVQQSGWTRTGMTRTDIRLLNRVRFTVNKQIQIHKRELRRLCTGMKAVQVSYEHPLMRWFEIADTSRALSLLTRQSFPRAILKNKRRAKTKNNWIRSAKNLINHQHIRRT